MIKIASLNEYNIVNQIKLLGDGYIKSDNEIIIDNELVVSIGDKYIESSGLFEVTTPEPLTVISKPEFWNRATRSVRVELTKISKSSVDVEVDLSTIAELEFINLVDQEIVDIVNRFKDYTEITQEHCESILKIG